MVMNRLIRCKDQTGPRLDSAISAVLYLMKATFRYPETRWERTGKNVFSP